MAINSLFLGNNSQYNLEYASLILNGNGDTDNTVLTVQGKAHITGDLDCDGLISAVITTSTADSTSTDSGGLIVAGGLGVEKNTHLNHLYVDSEDLAEVGKIGATVIQGGIYVCKNAIIDDKCDIGGTLSTLGYNVFQNTTESNDIYSGSVTIAGGLGVVGNLNVGGNITSNGDWGDTKVSSLEIIGTEDATDYDSGALQCDGGVGIAKSLYVNLDIESSNGDISCDLGTLSCLNVDTHRENITNDITEQLKLSYDTNIYTDLKTDSLGNLNIITNNSIKCPSTVDSTGLSSGALQITGGGSINKNMHIGEKLEVHSTEVCYDLTTGAVIIDGGLAVRKKMHIGDQIVFEMPDDGNAQLVLGSGNTNRAFFQNDTFGNCYIHTYGNNINAGVIISNTNDASNTTTGSLQIRGGMACGKQCHINGEFYAYSGINAYNPNRMYDDTTIDGILTVSNQTDIPIGGATIDSTTGAMIIKGGTGILKRLGVGDKIRTWSNEDADVLTATAGALIVDGGANIQKSLIVGDDVHANMAYLENSGSSQIQLKHTAAASLLDIGVDGAGNSVLLSSGNVYINPGTNNKVTIDSALDTTSFTNGSLVVRGGIGINGNVVANSLISCNTLNVKSTDDSTNIGSGAIITSGGASIAKNASINGQCIIYNTTQANNTNEGALICYGGLGVMKNLIGNTIICSGELIRSTGGPQLTIQHSYNTGLGISIDASGNCALDTTGNIMDFSSTDKVRVLNTTDYTGTNTGALYVAGGIEVMKNTIFRGNSGTSSNWLTCSNSFVGSCGFSAQAQFGNGISVFNNTSIFRATVLPQLSIQYNSSTYCHVSVDNGGSMLIDTTGDSLNFSSTDKISILNTGDSTAIGSGALVVNGGCSIGKSLFCGGQLNATNTGDIQLNLIHTGVGTCTIGVDTSNDTLLNAPQNLYINTANNRTIISSVLDTVSYTNGSLICSGGMGLAKNLYTNGNINSTGAAVLGGVTSNSLIIGNDTTDASGTNSGSLIIKGGIGIAKNAYVRDLFVENNTSAQIRMKNTTSIGPAGYDQLYMNASSELVLDSVANIKLNTSASSNVQISSTLDSTNSSTGALIIPGGCSIGKTIYLAGGMVRETANLDITGAGPLNNLVLPSKSIVYLTGSPITNNVQLTGFSGHNNINGYEVHIICYSATNVNVVIVNEGAGSTAANRIITNNGANLTLQCAPIGHIVLIYNTTLSRWVMGCYDP